MPKYEDSHEILDTKWRQWVHAESYKRQVKIASDLIATC